MLDRLFEAAPLGMALLDPELHVLRANAELGRIARRDPEAMIGRPVSEALGELFGSRFDAGSRAVLRGGKALRGVHLVVGEDEESKRHLQFGCYPVRVGDRLVGVGVVLEEVTRRRRREDLHRRLLAIASHDLKTPITAISLSAQTLLRAMAGPRESSLVRGILASASRVDGIVRDLVDYAVLQRGAGIPIRRAPDRIDQLCSAVAEECQAAEPSARVVCSGEGDPEGEWDAGRLAQAISNLVSNALRYGDPQAAVELRWDGRSDSVVSVHVRNAGAPIPEGTLPELFGAFRRGPGEQRGSGLGLGLYIARRIVAGHGGRLGASSCDSGTVFTLTVPRRPRADG